MQSNATALFRSENQHLPRSAVLRSFSKAAAVGAACLVLHGCAPFTKPVLQHLVQPEDGWAATQRHANVQAVVFEDEEYFTMRLSAAETMAGVGVAKKAYRRAPLFMVHSEGGKPFLNFKGAKHFTAIVPDGMPMLKYGDVVEVRYASVYDGLKDFAITGEGSAVLRILCPTNTSRAEVDAFKACATTLAWHEQWGEGSRFYDGIMAAPSGRPYAKSLEDHTELAFHPYYDAMGKPLPSAVSEPHTRALLAGQLQKPLRASRADLHPLVRNCHGGTSSSKIFQLGV